MNDQQAVGEKKFTCEDCGEEYEGYSFLGSRSRYCSKCKSKRMRNLEGQQAEERERELEFTRQAWLSDPIRGIPRQYRALNWTDFLFDRGGENNDGKVQRFQEYAAGFPVGQTPFGVESLLITRDLNGVGKTLLGSLILKDMINRCEEIARKCSPFQFWPISRVKQRLRSAERYSSLESVEEVYRDFATVRLLLIDDVGKEKLDGADAAFIQEAYFTIINERYNANLPIILTSNLNFDPWVPGGLCLENIMGRAAVSRLMEMTLGTAYIIEGEDRR